jgi:Ca2+:H+ antiporter
MRWSIHWLLIAVPGAIALKALGAGAPLLFFCAALAIVPLAVLIVHSTEHLAIYTGPALGDCSTRPSATFPSSSSRWWRSGLGCSTW